MVLAALERETERYLYLDGQRYRVASRGEAAQVVSVYQPGARSGYEVQWHSKQGVDSRQPFELPLKTFHLGYGFSFAEAAGTYERADGWTADASGRLSTWGLKTTCEPFISAATRGFEIEYNGFHYVFRGEWAVKYRPQDGNAEWPIIERHYFGANARVNGPPVAHAGSLYIPLRGLTIATLERFQRLSTSVDTVAEVQTITQSGSPTGGTWTATYNDGLTTTTVTGLAWNITDAALQAALRTIPGLQKVTVVRTGASNFVWTITLTGAPSALGTSSPPQFTVSAAGLTGGTPVLTPATTVAGTSDRWDRGPTGAESTHFAFFDGKLTRALGNVVSSADADPLTLANWGAEYPVGDATRIITQLGVFERFLVPVKEDGVWTFDDSATAIPEPLGIEYAIDTRAGVGLAVAHAFMFIPHRTGPLRWRPGGPFAYVGAEQDGQFDAFLSPGSGRVEAIAPYGKTLYFTANDTQNAKGVIGSWTPGSGERGPYTPHMHHLLPVPVEDVKVISYVGAPVSTLYPATVVNDATVGANNWTNVGNVSILDQINATLATYGISRYIKTTGFGFAIPADWTINGIMALIRRDRAGGDITTTFSYTGGAQNFVVPAGVTSITVDVQGAAGGPSRTVGGVGGAGGRGARVRTTIAVTPGETLVVHVGGVGAGPTTGAGGYNGGGQGGTANPGSVYGGGGGGGSDIMRSTAKLAVAGGGGGAALYNAGGGGSQTGVSGTSGDAAGGIAGGLGATGGAGYNGGSGGAAGSGAGGAGGAGGATNTTNANADAGGGGGGGNVGGGGGGGAHDVGGVAPIRTGGGGGGGSSWAVGTGTIFEGPYRSGNGTVVITYATADHIDDYSVKLVKAGTIGGSEKAFAVNWARDTPSTFAYGGPTDKWGLPWTPADVNDPTFGVAFAAQLFGSTGAISAKVDSIALQVYATPPGGGQPRPFLVVMTTDTAGTTCTPYVYDLPVNGQQLGNDRTVAKAVSDKNFYGSRYYAPEKAIQKQYVTAEVWAEFDPVVNIPGVVVWARVGEGAEFRLELADGNEVIREGGFSELFFPPTAASIGDYVQLRFEVPALASGEVPVAVLRFEVTVRGLYQPLRTEIADVILVLDPEDRRTVRQQMNDLLAISQRGHAPVPMQDIYGEDGWCHVPMPAFREFPDPTGVHREDQPQKVAAILELRKVMFR